MFYQAGDEDDEARKVGSESDVLDFVEARVKSSLAALATHSGDDATSLGDDAKPHDTDAGSETVFSDQATKPLSPSSSRDGATTGFKKRWVDPDWSDDD
ncbi:unnamed protein product, partial [Pylaiella littoralis]